jgi:glycosyltransferase involved in cell wall biosynthesis
MDISVVIPLLNEHESLPELVGQLHGVIGRMGKRYELILVDDGSRDGSWEVIQRLHAADGRVKGIKLGRNYGKSPALNEGFLAAEGRVVITMDADLQDDPEEIPELWRMITEEGYDLVSGWKQKRLRPLEQDLAHQALQRHHALGQRREAARLQLRAEGLRRPEVVKAIEVYGEMHRYIPFIAKKEGFDRIGEKVGEAPRTQIRQDQVRAGPLHQRIPGPAHHHLRVPFRQKAHALLRQPWAR